MAKMLAETEMADVEIMLEQMHYIFDGRFISRTKREKLERLEKLIKGDSDAIHKRKRE